MSDPDDILESRVGYLVPLNKLPAERLARLLAQSEVLSLRKKETLFKQGERDDYTFYVLEGDIEMYADDSLIKRVTGGDGASFQPLAQLQPRQMSAIAKTRSRVLRLNRGLLDQLLSMDAAAAEPATGVEVEEVETEQAGDWLMALLQSELFTRIPPSNIQDLLDTLESVSLDAGEDVVRQGDPGDYYYVIQNGRCEVVRRGARQQEIRLAELSTGDTFGEEALVSGARRNATVRMLEAGELARLTKEDFTRLIKAPLLDAVSIAEARKQVEAGAVWLDVRFADEHSHNGLPDSLNIPVGTLRGRLDELDPQTSYVVYCDTGGRSSAAAFLLAERGLSVCYVKGGAVAEQVPEKAPAAETPAASGNSEVLEANALASTLGTDLEKARLTIEKAQAMMAEAEAMKRESERIVAEKLASERARLDAETRALQAKLEAAEKLRNQLTERHQAAQAEVTRREQEVDERVSKLEDEARRRLEAEERRLEAYYQKQADQIESLQADREAELRARLSKELAAERKKFEQEFLRTTQELEQAQEERRRALAAKEAATAEAQSLIAEFKQQQQALLNEQRAAFDAERKRLTAEAARIEKLRQEASQAREAAEAAKAATERELREALARQSAAPDEKAPAADISAIEQRASAADLELQQAVEAETAVVSAARDNEDELERTYDTANEINALLQKELDEWIGEQDKLQESTLQQAVLSRQKEMVERIRERAAQARSETEERNQSLLDEIASQLRDD